MCGKGPVPPETQVVGRPPRRALTQGECRPMTSPRRKYFLRSSESTRHLPSPERAYRLGCSSCHPSAEAPIRPLAKRPPATALQTPEDEKPDRLHAPGKSVAAHFPIEPHKEYLSNPRRIVRQRPGRAGT